MRSLEVSRETLPQLYVVEGKSDVTKLSQSFSGPILTTNGSAVTKELIHQLVALEDKYNIVLLLDPDGPGEKIRRLISDHLTYPVHVFIPTEHARSDNKKRIGIEHVSRETLERHLLIPKTIQLVDPISMSQMMDIGLVGTAGAFKRREFISNTFQLGLANAKTLRNKLQLFGVPLHQVLVALEDYHE